MVDGVLLDAHATDEGLAFSLATNNGIVRATVRTSYRLYLLPLKTKPEKIEESLTGTGLDAWIEEWRKPPWYDGTVRIVVARGPLRLLERIANKLELKGVARRVNNYPGPLVIALWLLGARPGRPVRITGDTVERTSNTLTLRVARVEAHAWHGPVSTVWEEPDYYVIQCSGYKSKARTGEEVMDALETCRPHIVEARIEDRWHLPRSNSWLWLDPQRNLVGAKGLLEWMRVSWLPWSMAHGAPIGKILTAAEAREAWRRRYLIDPVAPRKESFRPLTRLLEVDMAGAARLPRPGLYWSVIQLDFSSLYPSLISKYNISAETVGLPWCASTRCPAGHPVCLSRRGLVASVLGELVRERENAKREGDREKAEALKWILVSGFGYLGYRNSLFGSISAYECVTAYAREALYKAERAAWSHGYRVIHSIVDSIFIQPQNPSITVEELAQRISREVGVRIRVDARYNWLYIPETRKGSGAVNKYYGAIMGGRIKMRGIAAVRRDTPPFIARVQAGAIRILAKATGPKEFRSAQEQVEQLITRSVKALINQQVHPRLLVITKRISKPNSNTPWTRAAGNRETETIKYIMSRQGPWPVWKGPPPNIDTNYYLERLKQAISELPKPSQNTVQPRKQPIRTS